MNQSKTPRKRVANFTADEKALLAQIIKRHPVVESKLTDGKSVVKKKTAWEIVTAEFNSNAHVHKRDTITLKRAWDNLKAFTRKARAAERGSILRTGGGPGFPPQPPQQGAIISMVEEAAPVIICEIKNSFDSDGIILENTLSQESDFTKADTMDNLEADSMSIIDMSCKKQDMDNIPTEPLVQLDDTMGCQDETVPVKLVESQYVRKTADYIKREAVLRIKHLEAKNKIELQTLQVKKRAAVLEEERNKILLEKAKLELEELKNKIGNS